MKRIWTPIFIMNTTAGQPTVAHNMGGVSRM